MTNPSGIDRSCNRAAESVKSHFIGTPGMALRHELLLKPHPIAIEANAAAFGSSTTVLAAKAVPDVELLKHPRSRHGNRLVGLVGHVGLAITLGSAKPSLSMRGIWRHLTAFGMVSDDLYPDAARGDKRNLRLFTNAMGIISSSLRKAYMGISALIMSIADINNDFNDLVARISKPRLPNDLSTSTESFWMQNPASKELVNAQSQKFPESADIVIIGSGIAGASVAYAILTECKALGISKRVVILEARQTCSGATGRNGGHIKTAPHDEFSKLKKRFGAESAKKLVQFQMRHLKTLLSTVVNEDLRGTEARIVETVDIFTNAGAWKTAQKQLKELEEEMPDVARDIKEWDAEAAREKFGLHSHFYGAISYQAGAISAYRFVTSLYTKLLESYTTTFSIETNTIVEKITAEDNIERPFLISTSRGNISASHVVHATDAYAANLIPGLVGKVFSVRGHMTAQRQGTSFPKPSGSRSWSIIHARGFDYITQRPDKMGNAGGEIMAGGGLVQSPGKGMDEFGIWTDDETSFPIGSYLGGMLPMLFSPKTWGQDANGSKVKQMWTGCMGFTIDLLPFVGKLHQNLTGRSLKSEQELKLEGTVAPAEWIAAGFNGEGMVFAWLSGVAVGLKILGRDGVASEGNHWRPSGAVKDWLPEEMECTEERVKKATAYELANLL